MSSTATPKSSRLQHLLEGCGLFSLDQVGEILREARASGASLTDTVVDQAYAEEAPFLEALAKAMEVPFLKVGTMDIESDVLRSLPTKAVFQYRVVPVAIEAGRLLVATRDPFQPGLAEALRLASGRRIRFALSPGKELDDAAKGFYGVGGETIEQMMAEGRIDLGDDEVLGATDLDDLDEDATIVKFVNQIVYEARKQRATDIHLEPMEKDLRIRYRIDGVLHQTPVPAALKRFQSAVISRIKVMANMDIAEKRLPQDGRISVRIKNDEIDIRVSTMPTTYGESISLRLLSRGSAMMGMGHLGLNERDTALLEKIIHKPHGIILVTGATGSGKSTSLYAYLHTINSMDKRLITVEDPIEYEMAGVNQINVRSEIGLTFARGLRHILRQDPDVIMIGEIRDRETAEIAIQAALTGHLVFSTLHTNDAAGAVTRLVDMGIEPFLVSSSLEALIAQRLVRRLCDECKAPAEVNRSVLKEAGFPAEKLSEGTIHEPVGCEACRGTGYSGRTGIYEVLIVTDALRPLITAREPSSVIKAKALEAGMRTLRDDGWEKVLQGITTIEEVLRVSEEDEEFFEGDGRRPPRAVDAGKSVKAKKKRGIRWWF